MYSKIYVLNTYLYNIYIILDKVQNGQQMEKKLIKKFLGSFVSHFGTPYSPSPPSYNRFRVIY